MKKITILVPPPAILDEQGRADGRKITRYYRWMRDNGIGGFFINGSTGEFTILDDEQKIETVRIARAAVGEDSLIIAGAIAGSVDMCVKLAAGYKDAGADAVAVCPPYFFRHSQENIIQFMRKVADRSVLPVYLYDIPAFTTPMTFETIVEIAKHPNVHGLKDSSRDFARFESLLSTIKACRPEFKIFTGTEELLLASLIMGADGATVATAGIEAEKIMQIVQYFQAGELEKAREIQFSLLPLIRKWFAKDFPEGFREAIAEKGFL